MRIFSVCFVLLACLVSGCSDTTTDATPVVAAISSIGLSATSVLGGTALTGTVSLNAVAPTGGAVVTLASSSAAVVVPPVVTVAAGATSQTFPITTTSLAASAVITGTYLTLSQTATLTVTVVVVPALQSLSLSTNVSSSGIPVNGTIVLTSPAPSGGLPVSLASNSPFATVPAVVTVPFGQTNYSFSIGTTDSPIPATAVITASYGGVARTAALTIGHLALSLLVGSVPGGLSVTGLITLPAPAPDGGAVVTLASSSPDAIVPASTVVPGGATSQPFTVATINAPPTTSATITASYAGSSQSATLVVVAIPNVVSVTCTPASPSGGATMQCTGTLASPSPAGGWRLAGASSDPSVVPPSSIIVAPSSSTFTFSMATTTVTAATTVSVQLFDSATQTIVWGQIVTVTP